MTDDGKSTPTSPKPPTPPRRYFQTTNYGGEPILGSGYTLGELAGCGLAAGGTALLFFASARYRIASPSQYLVLNGLGRTGNVVVKKGMQWPFQRAHRFSMEPRNYKFSLTAMSKEKMEFVLPGVFTVGPSDTPTDLQKYVGLMGEAFDAAYASKEEQSEDKDKDKDKDSTSRARGTLSTTVDRNGDLQTDMIYRKLDALIRGVVEGETRGLSASMEIEQIFIERDAFRENVTRKVQEELANFGLRIYNANIRELEDAPGSEYFVHARQRKRASAENTAREDIANAKYLGDVAVSKKESETRVQRAQFEATAVTSENSRQIEIAKSTSERDVKRAEYDRAAKIAQIEAAQAAATRKMELQRALEQRAAEARLEAERATVVVNATVEAEAKQRMADATLYQATKEAEAIRLKYDAQAEGLRNLLSCSDPQTVIQYSMIDRGVFQALASENAKAIQGLAPRIWVTGANSAESGASAAIGNIIKSLPPLLTTLYEQTGMKPPAWSVDMDEIVKAAAAETDPIATWRRNKARAARSGDTVVCNDDDPFATRI